MDIKGWISGMTATQKMYMMHVEVSLTSEERSEIQNCRVLR